MKKFLYLFLIPALVLSGCAQEELSPVLVVKTPAPLAYISGRQGRSGLDS